MTPICMFLIGCTISIVICGIIIIFTERQILWNIVYFFGLLALPFIDDSNIILKRIVIIAIIEAFVMTISYIGLYNILDECTDIRYSKLVLICSLFFIGANLIFVPLLNYELRNNIRIESRQFVESDEVTEKRFELVSDEAGKYLYYYSFSNNSNEDYYVVYYKTKNKENEIEYKQLKILASKLTILNDIEESNKCYLYRTRTTHKKECINDDSVEPEITKEYTYKVYLPNGTANIALISSDG